MAETTREMVVRLTMDAGGFKKTASEINRQIKNIDSEMKNMGANGNKQSLMEEKLSLQKTAVDNLKKAVESTKTSLSNATTEKDKLLAAKKLSGLETQLTNAEAKALALKNQLSAANLIKFGTLATNFGRTMRTMGRSMSLYVTAPLAALGGKSYQAALDFESATVSMQKTVDETDTTKYEDIAAAFKEISENAPVDFVTLMELAGQAGALGVGADQIVEFVRSVAMISETADDLDASSGADMLARFLNVTEKGDFSNIENAASAVTELGNNTASTEGEILSMAQRMAATGTLAGVATEDILALAAGFVSVGINAEAGGTAAGKLMKQMSIAATSDEMNKFAEILGIDGAEFASAFQNDGANTMMLFFDALSQLDTEKQFGALEWLMENGMSEIRLNNLVSAAATNPNLFKNALEISREAYKDNTALAEEAQKRYDTAESYQRVQLNRMENAAANVGENLVDPIQTVITKVSDLMAKFAELDEGTQNWILSAGLGLALTGPVLTGLGGVLTAVGKISTAIGKAKLATSAWQGLMSSPVLWGIAAGGAALLALFAITDISTEADKIIGNLKNIKIELDEDSYNATMDAIAEVKAQTDALSGQTGEYNKNISSAVKAGFGTADMYGTALGYEASFTQQQITDIAGKYASQIDGLNAAIGEATDRSEQERLAAQRDNLQAQWNAEVQNAKDAYMEQVGALVSGMLQSKPEAKAALEQASKDYDLLVALLDAVSFSGESTDQAAIAKKWEEIFTPDVMARFFPDAIEAQAGTDAYILYDMLVASLNDALHLIEGEDSFAYTLLQSILGDPLSAGLYDSTKTQGVLDGIVEILDFKQAGENAGLDFFGTLSPGLADSVSESIPGIEGAMDTLTEAGIKKAAAAGAAMSAAFSANLKFNVPGIGGSGTGLNFNVNTASASDIYALRRALNDADARTARGYGVS